MEMNDTSESMLAVNLFLLEYICHNRSHWDKYAKLRREAMQGVVTFIKPVELHETVIK